MSYTTIHTVPEQGEITDAYEFKNAFRGAMHIWDKLAQKYLGQSAGALMFSDVGMKQVWALAERVDVPMWQRIVLGTTFDGVMVRRENLPTVAAAMRVFAMTFEPGSLLEQAEALDKIALDESVFAVCWTQTSVSGDTWRIWGEEDDEDDPGRGYDISKDNGHWFLFDELSLSDAQPDA